MKVDPSTLGNHQIDWPEVRKRCEAYTELVAALREYDVAIERMADIGKRRERTVSLRMETALSTARALLRRLGEEA